MYPHYPLPSSSPVCSIPFRVVISEARRALFNRESAATLANALILGDGCSTTPKAVLSVGTKNESGGVVATGRAEGAVGGAKNATLVGLVSDELFFFRTPSRLTLNCCRSAATSVVPYGSVGRRSRIAQSCRRVFHFFFFALISFYCTFHHSTARSINVVRRRRGLFLRSRLPFAIQCYVRLFYVGSANGLAT